MVELIGFRGKVTVKHLKQFQNLLDQHGSTEVGGCMVNGQLQAFEGLEAELSSSQRIPAAVALKLAKSPVTFAEHSAEVPLDAVMAGMEAAKKALHPVTKKAKIKKLLAIPLLGLLLTLAVKFQTAQRFFYAFAVSMYLSAYVLPPPLVLILPLATWQ